MPNYYIKPTHICSSIDSNDNCKSIALIASTPIQTALTPIPTPTPAPIRVPITAPTTN